MKLSGKTVVLTGAGHGLGRALALALAANGCHLALIDLDEHALAELAANLAVVSVRVSLHGADISQHSCWPGVLASILEQHGAPDLLINNAGVFLQGRFEEYEIQDFEWLMRVNFWGPVYAMRTFLPELKKRPEARIVNILSCFALVGFPSMSACCASKFALDGLSMALRCELGETSVGMSLVYPGSIATHFMARARAKDKEKAQSFDAHLKKKGLSAEQVAAQILVGVARERMRIHIGAEGRIAELWRRMAPVWGNNHFRRLRKRHPEL